jgi:PilZ domain-containing protein
MRKKTSQVHFGRGTNMSEGGLQALIASEIELAEEIEIEITMPYYSSQPLKLPCVVRDRDGYKYGLEFQTAKQEDRDIIAKACAVLSLIYDHA